MCYCGCYDYRCYYGFAIFFHCYLVTMVPIVTFISGFHGYSVTRPTAVPIVITGTFATMFNTVTSVHCMLWLRKYATSVSLYSRSLLFKFNMLHIGASNGKFNILTCSAHLHRKYIKRYIHFLYW
jgi:hypothetical protein